MESPSTSSPMGVTVTAVSSAVDTAISSAVGGSLTGNTSSVIVATLESSSPSLAKKVRLSEPLKLVSGI